LSIGAAVSGQPFGGGSRLQFDFGPLVEIPMVFGVASRDLLEFAALHEFLERVGPRRLEQPIPPRCATEIRREERLRDQVRAVDDFRAGDLANRRYRTRRLQCEAAGKDCQAPQDHTLGLRQQLIAPVERRPQRLVPRQRRAAAARQQVETIIEAGREVFDPERGRTRCRQLDRQRDPVEAPADCGDRRHGALVRREMRLRRARPRNEQPHGAVSQRVRRVLAALRRHRERRHQVETLTLCSQRLAARRHYARCRVGAKHCFGHACRGADEMLAIVEHQQELFRGERIRDAFGRYSAAGEVETELSGDGDRHEVGIRKRRELDSPNPVGEFWQ